VNALPIYSSSSANVPEPERTSPVAWPIALLGVPFDHVTLTGAVDRIDLMIRAGTGHYVVTANVDFLVQARKDAELRRILVDADLVLCDGTPLVWASRWLGNALPGRAAGSDLVPLLLKRAAARRWKIFILGGAPQVAAEAARRIALQHPTLPPVSHYSPPIQPLAEMNQAEIVSRIKAAKPDLLLVSFGCPKQEKWISMHYAGLGVPVTIGVGATVDFLAGHVRRAPRWMQRSGTEWMFRLAQEPRRLFRRYSEDLRQFLPALLAQRRDLPPPASNGSALYAPVGEAMYYGLKVRACETLDRDALHRDEAFWKRALDQRGHCFVDLGEVRTIDSTGLAFLAYWQKRLARRQRNLVLFRPSRAVREALIQAGLADHFSVTDGSPYGFGIAAPKRPDPS